MLLFLWYKVILLRQGGDDGSDVPDVALQVLDLVERVGQADDDVAAARAGVVGQLANAVNLRQEDTGLTGDELKSHTTEVARSFGK